jgi:hypothetical protein
MGSTPRNCGSTQFKNSHQTQTVVLVTQTVPTTKMSSVVFAMGVLSLHLAYVPYCDLHNVTVSMSGIRGHGVAHSRSGDNSHRCNCNINKFHTKQVGIAIFHQMLSSNLDQNTTYYDLTSFVVFLSLSRQTSQLGRDCFLPNPLQFNSHQSSWTWILYELATDSFVGHTVA